MKNILPVRRLSPALLLTVLLVGSGLWAGCATTGVNRGDLSLGAGVLLGSDPSTLERLAAQIAGAGAIAKFSRDDEREADRLGLRYMYEANHDPRGMAAMFETLLSEQKRRPSTVEQFFSTHPLTSKRIQDARRRARKLPDRSGLAVNDRQFPGVRRVAARY